MAPRHRRQAVPVLLRLGQDPELVLVAPASPPIPAGEDLDTAHRAPPFRNKTRNQFRNLARKPPSTNPRSPDGYTASKAPASRRSSFTSSGVALRAVSPASRLFPFQEFLRPAVIH
jgi:hypothetical protein